MSTRFLVITIATVFFGTTVTMPLTAAGPTQDTAIETNAFNQFESFVKSKAPEHLDEAGLQTFLDGVTDYIYGYSLLSIAMTERVATTVSGLTPLPYACSYQSTRDRHCTAQPTYHDVVLPSTTTLYASSFMDLTNGPLILHVPELPAVVGTIKPRFFIVELLDAWTNVSRRHQVRACEPTW